MSTHSSSLKKRAIAAIDAESARLIEMSDTLHANPELSFQEYKSASMLSDALQSRGFTVQRGVGTLETAFRAEARGHADSPTVALCAEYDALPELGHACGHNIIGTAAVGAAIGIEAVLDEIAGRVVVVGTPAEEGGGGKVILLANGVFKDVDAAMMIHPASWTMVSRGSLASFRLNIEFAGRASHAASSPEAGINALEAVILTFNNINALRLHLRADARVHGIITNGGAAANIIPDYASAAFSVRAASQDYANEILPRVIACAEAAATATGAKLTHTVATGYAAMKPNMTMARLFAANWRSIGVEVHEPRPNERMGSTDFGNISQALPGIHPYIAIAPDGTPGHSVEFRAASASPAGRHGLLVAAKALAMTTIELLNEPDLLRQAKEEFAAIPGKAK